MQGCSLYLYTTGTRLTTHGEESWQGGTRMSSLRGGWNAAATRVSRLDLLCI